MDSFDALWGIPCVHVVIKKAETTSIFPPFPKQLLILIPSEKMKLNYIFAFALDAFIHETPRQEGNRMSFKNYTLYFR